MRADGARPGNRAPANDGCWAAADEVAYEAADGVWLRKTWRTSLVAGPQEQGRPGGLAAGAVPPPFTRKVYAALFSRNA